MTTDCLVPTTRLVLLAPLIPWAIIGLVTIVIVNVGAPQILQKILLLAYLVEGAALLGDIYFLVAIRKLDDSWIFRDCMKYNEVINIPNRVE